MAQRIIIPRMGQTMTEGTVSKWYVKDGDSVKAGDEIYELEYDKSTASIEAKTSGIVRLLCEEGDTVLLGHTVAVILENGEKLEDISISGEHEVANSGAVKEEEEEKAEAAAPVAAVQPASGKILASPLARKLAKDKGIDLSEIKPTKADGAIRAADVLAFTPQVEHNCEECNRCSGILATPLARKLAKEKGIDLADIKPADGVRIYKEDVLAFAETKVQKKAVSTTRVERRVKLSGMRKVIAERMNQSYFTYPTATLHTTADMTDFMKMRKQLNAKLADRGVKLSVSDILIKIVGKALAENEIINTSLEGDEIVYHADINVGFAVALDNGLVVPVVKNADALSLEEISVDTKRLIKMVKSGKIPVDETNCGTFSITNLGMFGIDAFSPIINYPQSAILGIGRTVDTFYLTENGTPAKKPVITLSLTHDHRLIDGTPAAKFLSTIVGYIENPYTLFID